MNTHFHLGAEHLHVDASGYSLTVEEATKKPDNIILDDIRPGYFCDRVKAEPAPPATLDPYEFKHCKNVKVGYTCEFHWVCSSAGPKDGILTRWLRRCVCSRLEPIAGVWTGLSQRVALSTTHHWKCVQQQALHSKSRGMSTDNLVPCQPR